MPHLTPMVAAIYIWIWLLNPQYGLINEIILQAGVLIDGHRHPGPELVRRPELGACPR